MYSCILTFTWRHAAASIYFEYVVVRVRRSYMLHVRRFVRAEGEGEGEPEAKPEAKPEGAGLGAGQAALLAAIAGRIEAFELSREP